MSQFRFILVLRIVVAVCVLPLSAFAFDPDKCGELFPKAGDAHRPYLAPFYSTTMAPSITSYLSSFGKCSLYGSHELRGAFIRETYDQLTLEAAMGKGEYITALAGLSGCPSDQTANFSQTLQSHYTEVFQTAQEKDFQQIGARVGARLDALIAKSVPLSKNCKILN